MINDLPDVSFTPARWAETCGVFVGQVFAACVVILVLWVPTARAGAGLGVPNLPSTRSGLIPAQIPRLSLTVGGSAGAFFAKGIQAGLVSVEVTGAWRLAWLSAGLRGAFGADASHFLPYVEVGFCLVVVNLGVGYTAGFSVGGDDRPRVPAHNVHLFVGVPVPVWKARNKANQETGFLYLQPYYRPQWGAGGGATGFCHEVGLMVKMSFSLLPRREVPKRPGDARGQGPARE